MFSTSRKKKIGVVRGGPSHEYNFSLDTGAHVLMCLEDECDTKDILIDKDGKWIVAGKYTNPEKALWDLDVVFNALHGAYGEDGKIQDILEAHSIPYTGSDSFSSASALNKQTAKKFFKAYGLETPFYKMFSREEGRDADIALGIFNTFPLPLIIKPASSGASFGINSVFNFTDLEKAVAHAFQYGDTILAEEYIDGVAVTCGVVEHYRDRELYTPFPVQIKLPHKSIFLEYEKNNPIEYMVPAPIGKVENENIQELSKLAHRILGLRHYSASDFIISPGRGIFLLETNSLPHLGSHSPFVSALEALGSSRDEFIKHILSLVK